MKEQLTTLKAEALRAINVCDTIGGLDALKQEYVGRKGKLTELLRQLKSMSLEDKKLYGSVLNNLKPELEELFEKRLNELYGKSDSELATKEWIDLTVRGKKQLCGGLHPLTEIIYEIENVFTSMGFEIADGPEVEDDYHNFTALNIPEDHPARDMQDTLWLANIPKLLRTHTSSVQIRYMQSHEPPVRIICPGRVFRKDDIDATHSPCFHQYEGLMIGEDISLADLKGVLTFALRKLIHPDLEIRFRSSFFPFVEPGLEVDVRFDTGKKNAWIELLGAGMVHPNVLTSVGYDPEKVQGFAFGCGIERIAMVKHKIDDIRLFYENDPRFLRQF